MIQHKSGTFDGFTKKYKVDRLVYLETYTESKVAADREQQMKKYRREKKIALFSESNPEWKDLTAEFFQTNRDPSPSASSGSGFQKKRRSRFRRAQNP
jgi:predicted GIY-YIG superfamily endonuclease